MSSLAPPESSFSTDCSTLPSTTPTSDSEDNSQTSFVSYRDLSGNTILKNIHDLQPKGILYAGNRHLNTLCEFIFNKDIRGDALVHKNNNKALSEFVLAGVFEVDAHNFFMTSDGKWNMNNPLGTRLDQVKPSCHLLPVQRVTDFLYSSDDFPTVVANIKAIETLANPRKTREHISVLTENPVGIKLCHSLFIDKKFALESNENDYTIQNWPVSASIEPYLDAIKSSHVVQQLPAYDVRGNDIHPSEYEEKLAGAITRVCFSIVHFLIKQKHIYNAVLRDITVLRPPTTVIPSSTSLKHILHPKLKSHMNE